MVIDVEFDGLRSEVSVDAPKSFRHRLSYSPAVKVGNKVSFKLILRIYGDGKTCGGCSDMDNDEVTEEIHEISSDDDGDDDYVKGDACEPPKPPVKRCNEEASPGNRSGSKKDECGDDSFDCKDFGKGSCGKPDEEEQKEEVCGNPCSRESEFGSEDMKVPCNGNPQSSNSGSGQNPEKKDDDDCVKGGTFGQDKDYVPEECRSPENREGTTFQQEEESTYDDQYDCLGSFSFEDGLHAEFLSDFAPPQSRNSSDADTTNNADNNVEDSIVNEREEIKKTDGYKHAVEAEWAARQQEIQKQAEEAQRLRKRRKLELSEAKKKAEEEERQLKRKKTAELRASEIKMRQEQRVKDMREAEKKDEEDWKAKERYCDETRRKISLLQGQCRDLPSLLRSLGFSIAGGMNPSQGEVRRAYREALLKYHPDHWSKTDIHQQVEAEEMIKLINLMRGKFSSRI